jgi:hypothetical protein
MGFYYLSEQIEYDVLAGKTFEERLNDNKSQIDTIASKWAP